MATARQEARPAARGADPGSARGTGVRTVVAHALAVGVTYYVGSLAGLGFLFPGSHYSVVWPPNAVLVLALLLLPRREWLAALGVATLVHVVAQRTARPEVIGLMVVHNTGLALTTALLCDRFIGRPLRLEDLGGAVRFTVIAVIGAPALFACTSPVFRALRGLDVPVLEMWWQHFFSNALAMVLIVPPVQALRVAWTREETGFDGERLLEAALLVVCVLLAVTFAVGSSELAPTALLALPLPFLLWAAIRFGTGGAALAVGALFVAVVLAALRGSGPFPDPSLPDAVFSLQAFTLNLGVTLLLVAALVREREVSNAAAREVEQVLLRSLETSGTAAWRVDLRSRRAAVWGSMTQPGGAAGCVDVPLSAITDAMHPDDRVRIEGELRSHGPPPVIDELVRARDPAGGRRWLLMRGRRVDDDDGTPIAITGASVDITARRRLELALRRSRARIRALARDVMDGREAERRSMGLRIQEEIVQDVAALSLDVGLARTRAADADPRLIEVLDRLQSAVNDLAADLSELARDLRSASLEHVGLGAALDTLAHTTRLRTRVPVEARTAGLRGVDAARASEAYQVIRDVLLHAAGRRGVVSIGIDVRPDGGWLLVDLRAFGVTDDAPLPGPLGERVRLFGGQVRTGMAHGTWRVLVRLRSNGTKEPDGMETTR